MLEEQDVLVNQKISELIPVACHYDSSTLITKNGDLIKTISISGFEPNDDAFNQISLREVLRKSILESITNKRLAIYIHNLNNEMDIEPIQSFKSQFANDLNKRWTSHNHWNSQLMSVIYVTIVVQGPKKSAFNPLHLHEVLFLNLYKKHHFRELEENCAILTKATNNIILKCSRFGARILEIKRDEEYGGYYSEPLSFFYNLLHLKEKQVFVEPYDASEQLADIRMNYGFNSFTLEALRLSDTKGAATTYGAVFSLKPFHDISIEDSLEILQHRYNYIVTEAIVLVPKQIASKGFNNHKKFLEAGRNQELLSIYAYDKVLGPESDYDHYCEKQLTITLYAKSPEDLKNSIEKLWSRMKTIGIIMVREDFNMPRCFWSTIPGNFRYISRKSYNILETAACFGMVPSSTMGSYNGSKWGVPVTIFQTKCNHPYYFNFHSHNSGHTIIIGGENSGKTAMTNFLLAQASKFNPKIIYIDAKGYGELFVQNMGGVSFGIGTAQESQLRINFFDPKNYDNNFDALEEAIEALLFEPYQKNSATKEACSNLLELLKSGMRTPEKIIAELQNIIINSNISAVSEKSDSIIHFVRNTCMEDQIDAINAHQIVRVDVQAIKNIPIRSIFINLMLSKIMQLLDAQPAIIVINQGHHLIANDVIMSNLIKSYRTADHKNAVIIFSMEYASMLSNYQKNLDLLMQSNATSIFLSDRNAGKDFKRAFNLSERELYNIKSYENNQRVMILKQHRKSINLLFDLVALNNVIEGLH